MFKSIVNFFHPPIFEDHEEARIAGFLYPVAASVVVLTCVVLTIWWATIPIGIFLRSCMMGLVIILLSLLCMKYIRDGKVLLASKIAAVGAWVAVMTAAVSLGGVGNPAFTSLVPLAMLTAGVLAGRAYSTLLALLSLLIGLIMLWAAHNGYLIEYSKTVDGPGFHLLGTLPALILIPIIVQIFHDNFAQLAQRTRQHEMERSHSELAKVRALQLESEIARQKEVEQVLIQARERAEEADKAKSQFLANMSHEIRTPLNAIIGMTRLVLDKDLGNEVRDDVETIRQSGELLLEILNEILDYSKVESGLIELEEQPVSLASTIDSVIDLITPAVRLKQLPIRYQIGDVTPPTIMTDVTRLRQILLNLVSNAVKFTEKGQIQIFVSSRHLAEQTHEIKFAIRDTGIGIPADKMDRLFQPFSQVDSSTTRKYGGTGLGLMISRRLSQHMGGQMWVESVENEGATFTFTIQAKAADAPLLPVPHRARRHEIERLTDHPLNILLVEDNLVNQKVAQRILQRLGYRADLAANGVEAVQSVQRQQYDLILMDINMPEMDGLEATIQISQLLPQECRPRIVAMTASGMPEDRERALQVGMDAFLIKPVRVEEIQRILASTHSFPALDIAQQLDNPTIRHSQLS